MEQSIELDCAPGMVRPGILISSVIEGTGLPLREANGKLFGNWKWLYPEIPEEEWKKIQPILKERIENLYRNGTIRYGS